MLRALVARYRFLPLLLLAPAIALWKINWLFDLDYMQAAPLALTPTSREAAGPAQGRQFYASEDHKHTVFTVDKVKYKWTTIHANVLEEEESRYMEVLAFLEDLTYDGPISIHHQVIVPPKIAQLVDKVTCTFEGLDKRTTASIRYEMPHAWYAVLIRCQIPEDVHLPTKSRVDLRLRDSAATIKHDIQLKPYVTENPRNTSDLAFCLSPMFGDLDLFKLLEWRLHHARLGVNTVHWYIRKPNIALETLVRILNHDEGLEDSWKEASPISPDTFETERLQEHGLYGDQVLYYIDCLERSKHLHPTKWLAFIDLDEFFLPEPCSLSGIDEFLDLSKHDGVGTICLDRNQADTTPTQGRETELLFEHLNELVERKEDHPTDNRKCLHRPSSLLVPFVHWPLLLREGKPSKEVVYNREGDSLRLLHASRKPYWGGKIPLKKTDEFQKHVQHLRRSVDYYLRTYSELFQ